MRASRSSSTIKQGEFCLAFPNTAATGTQLVFSEREAREEVFTYWTLHHPSSLSTLSLITHDKMCEILTLKRLDIHGSIAERIGFLHDRLDSDCLAW